MPPEQKPFRVLCLDGGGMRGLYTASLLDILSKRFHNSQEVDVGKAFDLIVGTSTGGLLAMALAHGIPLSKIIDLYRTKGRDIFPLPTPRITKFQPINLIKMGWWSLLRKRAVAAGKAALKRELETLFGETKFVDLYQQRGIAICIPAVRMQSQKAWIFKTPHNPGKTRDNLYRLVDICLATSAAPMLLPLHAIDKPDSVGYDVFADGGLWANNPTLVGVIEAAGMISPDQPIEVVSISTGSPPEGHLIPQDKTNWGAVNWSGGVEIANTAMNAQAYSAHVAANFLQHHISNLRVYRLTHTSPSQKQLEHVGMDKASNEAVTVLTDMATTDAMEIHSKAITPNNGQMYATINQIFTSMQPFTANQNGGGNGSSAPERAQG